MRGGAAVALLHLRELALGQRGRSPLLDEFVVRFQQTCGPVMAKGVEDTAFYRWNRFVALNEVGGSPSSFGFSVAAFHEAALHRQREWPDAMTTLSTHDTKRSEDVRARLYALTELPDAWGEAVTRWRARAQPYRNAQGWADATSKYLFWQTLVGAWPIDVDRMETYVLKAAREAKLPHRVDRAECRVRGRPSRLCHDAFSLTAQLIADVDELRLESCSGCRG